jgi:Fe(3+) dicitrate transport protein
MIALLRPLIMRMGIVPILASVLGLSQSILPLAPDVTHAQDRQPARPAAEAEHQPGVEPGSLSVGPTPLESPLAAPDEKPIKIPLTEVIGTSPDALEHIPGSGRVITQETIFKNHRLTINETLREVPGVNVRDEEGLGIRPNIGIRGLNPTRSRSVHIMEDGVPIMLMPYGDPSSYYFPPIFRFDRIEVLKGSGQLLYGPQNIGGVMNLITRMPPRTPQGNISFFGGNLNYMNTHFDYGGTWGKTGILADYTHYQSDTPRFTNVRAMVDDFTLKAVHELTDRSSLLIKFNYYKEDSGIGYQGLTESEFKANPRYTPFTNDHMDFRRVGFHVAHQYMFNANLSVTTNFFGHYITRDWSRQMQQGIDSAGNPVGSRQTGNLMPATAFGVAPANGRFKNAREYWVYGVEPRFHLTHRLLGINSEADFGVRYMSEQSERQQFLHNTSGIGLTCPQTQAGCLGEDTLRHTNAYAAFFQNRFFLTDRITVTPGVRVENVNYSARNRLANAGTGNFAETSITEVLPGIGATYSPVINYTLFAGVHRGFAPPQISDAVTLGGVVTDLDPELNWTYEVGLRGAPTKWMGFEFTLFAMDFENQIVAQSVAGGTGATLTNAGRTKHKGIEFATKIDVLDMVTGQNPNQDILFDVNYTWVAEAEFAGSRNSSLCPSTATTPAGCSAILSNEALFPSVSGNRLPYAPRHTLTAGMGYVNRPVGFDARVETQCISDMYSDDRNTVQPTPNGQRGVIAGWCVLNAAANQYVKPLNTTFFLFGKNLLDNTFIVDRSRGIYAGLPLMVQAGARWTF